MRSTILSTPLLLGSLVGLHGLLACTSSDATDVAHPPSPAANDAGSAPQDAGGARDAGGTLEEGSTPGVDAGKPPGNDVVVTYAIDTTTVMANPERGFYHHLETTNQSYSPLDEATLAGYRVNESISHVLRVFYLDGFTTQNISTAYLSSITSDFVVARKAGVKVIVRFAYTSDVSGVDASPAQVLAHIAQLGPILAANDDVIELVQAGFIGAWGEWYYTTHFGDQGTISASDWAARKSVVDALLAALPARRMVQLRTPAFMRTLYGSGALTATEAFSGTARARIGFHDDAFVSSSDDMGTYPDAANERPYIKTNTAYVPAGGENDAYVDPRTACPSATAEMALFHWSFLNTDYLDTTIANWKSQGCYQTMRLLMGYRLALVSGSYSASASVKGSAHVAFRVRNDGYASLFNPRLVELALRDRSSGAVTRVPIPVDPRLWAPGTTSDVDVTVPLGDVPAGAYDLLLALPDASPALHDRAEYAVRLANTTRWDDAIGANDLNAKLVVSP